MGRIGRIWVCLTAVAVLMAVSATGAGAFVYWANQKGDTVGRSALDGSQVIQDFIQTGGQPCGVAVDGRHVYWANSGGSTIGRANLDGTNVDQKFITGLNGPCGPSLNTSAGTIYWANTGTQTIGKATLKGTQVNPSFVSGSEAFFPSWTTDFGNQVYWTNKGDGSIARASDVDGSGAETFLPGNNAFQPLGVLLIPDTGVFGPALYWTSSTIGQIGEASLATGTPTSIDPEFITGLGFACGLAANVTHLFWGADSFVGRADIDGSSPQNQFISGANGACGVAVDQDRAEGSMTPDGELWRGPGDHRWRREAVHRQQLRRHDGQSQRGGARDRWTGRRPVLGHRQHLPRLPHPRCELHDERRLRSELHRRQGRHSGGGDE